MKTLLCLALVILSLQAKATYPILRQSLKTDGFPRPAELQSVNLASVNVVHLMADTRKLLKAFTTAKGVSYSYNQEISGPKMQSYAVALKNASALLTADGTVNGQKCSLNSIEISAAGVEGFSLDCGFGVNYKVHTDGYYVEIGFGYRGGDGSGSESFGFKGQIGWEKVDGKYQYVFTPKSLGYEYNGGS